MIWKAFSSPMHIVDCLFLNRSRVSHATCTIRPETPDWWLSAEAAYELPFPLIFPGMDVCVVFIGGHAKRGVGRAANYPFQRSKSADLGPDGSKPGGRQRPTRIRLFIIGGPTPHLMKCSNDLFADFRWKLLIALKSMSVCSQVQRVPPFYT